MKGFAHRLHVGEMELPIISPFSLMDVTEGGYLLVRDSKPIHHVCTTTACEIFPSN